MIALNLHGVVGESFTASSVQAVLRDGGPVAVTLNSGGGFASEGAAIYALLAAHPAPVTVDVVGIAASAASLIAMAGSVITMRAGSVMMIHDPMNITVGNSADHAKAIEQLEAYAVAYARIYGARTGRTPVQARALMRAETWYDGEAAVAAGFATRTDTAAAVPYASYDYKRYRDADRAFAAARGAPAAQAATAKAGWRKVINRLNGTKEISDPAANHGWPVVTAKHNARIHR